MVINMSTATVVQSTNGIVRAASRPRPSREHLAAAATAAAATTARPHLLDVVDW